MVAVVFWVVVFWDGVFRVMGVLFEKVFCSGEKGGLVYALWMGLGVFQVDGLVKPLGFGPNLNFSSTLMDNSIAWSKVCGFKILTSALISSFNPFMY